MTAAALRFAKFSGAGAIGFAADAGVFQALVTFAALSPYAAKIASYFAAATVTWWLNRTITFRDSAPGKPHAQWMRFLAVNAVGACVNYVVFAVMYAAIPFVHAHPLIAVAAGALAGLVFNFTLSEKFVFRQTS